MNTYIYIAIAVAILCVLFIIYSKRKEVEEFLTAESTRQFIKKLIIEAEKEIVGTKRGQERLKLCISRVYLIVPVQIKAFISEEMLINTINTIFSEIAKKMEDGTTKAVEEV